MVAVAINMLSSVDMCKTKRGALGDYLICLALLSKSLYRHKASRLVRERKASRLVHECKASRLVHERRALRLVHERKASRLVHERKASRLVHERTSDVFHWPNRTSFFCASHSVTLSRQSWGREREVRRWERKGEKERREGVSSFLVLH